jgi:hypothetical protein
VEHGEAGLCTHPIQGLRIAEYRARTRWSLWEVNTRRGAGAEARLGRMCHLNEFIWVGMCLCVQYGEGC